MTPADYLIDTSALVRLMLPAYSGSPWLEVAHRGLIAIAEITELEVLYGARSHHDRVRIKKKLGEVFLRAPRSEAVYERADRVQELLTERGQHRGPGPVDLLVAASAELAGLSLLHHDHDFDTIRRATKQPMVWLDEPGG